MFSSPIIIGIVGGTGSGKSTLCKKIADRIGSGVSIVRHDIYYKDLSHLPLHERNQQNFDHPAALDNELFISHISALKQGISINVPCYDFTTHTRTPEIQRINPVKTILAEGIMLYTDKRIRDLLDYKIYIDLDADIRFIRRLKRDIEERGRSVESVIEQYLSTVRPMHIKFVEPSKRYADLVVLGENHVAADRIISMIQQKNGNHHEAHEG